MTSACHAPSSSYPTQSCSLISLGWNTGRYMSTEQPALELSFTNKTESKNEDEDSTETLPPSPSKSYCPISSSSSKIGQPSRRQCAKLSVNEEQKVENEDKDTPSPYPKIYDHTTPHSSPLSHIPSMVPSSLNSSPPSSWTSVKHLNVKKTPLIPWPRIRKPSIISPQSVQILMNYEHINMTFW